MKEFEGQLSEDDMVRAYYLHSRTRFRRDAWLWFSICALVVVIQFVLRRPNLFYVAIVLCLPAAMLYHRFLLIPRLLRREFRQKAVYGSPYHTEVTDIGFETRQGTDCQKRLWTEIRAWRENDEYFLLYESDHFYRIAPKRQFHSAAEQEEFRTLLVNKIGPKK